MSGGVKGCEWESLSNALSANSEITALRRIKGMTLIGLSLRNTASFASHTPSIKRRAKGGEDCRYAY